MKRYLSIGLAVVAILLTANTSVEARGKTEVVTKSETFRPLMLAADRPSLGYITPFDLVTSAYQGQYRDHFIPGFGSFIYGIRTGKITAKDLVKAAINSKRLPPQAIADRSYLGYVDLQFKSIQF
ncbi:hypothetical protein [Chamaesiphon minutus]|uniref:Uncharacterized protein n=1 Tax=Chamaesiphon minutus (strain ATCC 27169 / PCC 6605) TaxID=1173020 RepID=K9USE9_CHAP6|nr:hypothetical protein [Chamaesiphon minutus]AFY97189.1 hypothetical protein Cha6605_6367 [Chamaesiphon minutus PCC 6605]